MERFSKLIVYAEKTFRARTYMYTLRFVLFFPYAFFRYVTSKNSETKVTLNGRIKGTCTVNTGTVCAIIEEGLICKAGVSCFFYLSSYSTFD